MLQNDTLTKEKLLNCLDGLDHGLKRVSSIIEKVRSYKKGNVDRDQNINLVQALDNARDSLPQQLLQALPLKISIKENLHVLADQLELELLLNNLLNNAIAAAVQAENPVVCVSAHAHADSVIVTIENSGLPVSEQNLIGLTIPFVSEKGSGHGLGVPISMSLAEANGGHLAYRRRDGGGLIATIVLRSAS